MFSPFTENIFRLPGHSVRQEISKLSEDFSITYFVFCFSALALGVFIIMLNGRGQFTGVVVASVGLIVSVWKIIQQLSRVRDYKLGCEGEEYTGQELNLLMRRGAFVFHDIPYKYGNIDHIVFGNDCIFVVETKAIRKPKNVSGSVSSRKSVVEFDGDSLKFPHRTTSDPIKQAERHASYLTGVIQKRFGFEFQVIPVVALPGWCVENGMTKNNEVLVINPKRGKALVSRLGEIKDKQQRNQLVNHIASVARSITPSSNKTDPDAKKNYDFWLNPKHKETLLGEG